MEIIKVKDYQELSQFASEIIIKNINKQKNITLGLATGSTPIGTYQKLVKDHIDNKTSYKNVKTLNLDEYIGLSPTHPNSYRFFMNQKLFNHIDIQELNIHIPDGSADDLQKECIRYDQIIEQLGGTDLQLLGLGQNGHIGFNEPYSSFQSTTHIVQLDESTRKANARFFQSLNEVPTHAITMGISSILKSKGILVLVSGNDKAEALSKLLTSNIRTDFPASVLKTHPKVTIIADYDALSLLDYKDSFVGNGV